MTPQSLLEEVSQALFRSWWPVGLGEILGVHERSVRRWQAGTHPIPEGIFPELATECRKRATGLNKLADALDSRKRLP